MFIRILFSVLFLAFLSGFSFASEEKKSNGVVDFIPLFQEQTRQAGQVPPKPFFISPIFFYMEDYMNISDVTAQGKIEGINHYFDADVTMDDVTTNTTSSGIRAGAWIFPFLNVYGMYLYTDGYTEFEATAKPVAGILPRGYKIKNKLKFSANTYALGATAAYGIPKIFFNWDAFGIFNANIAWSDANLINTMVKTVVFSPRIGLSREIYNDMKLSMWFGGMYKEMLGDSEWVDGSYSVRLSEADVQGGMLEPLTNRNVESSYHARQRPKAPWNLVVGADFSPCRYFSLMTEVGFINRLTVNVGVTFNF